MAVSESPISHQEALIYVMVTLSAADTTMTDRELSKIGDVVKTLPMFRDYNPEDLIKAAEACGEILQEADGLDVILDKVAGTLPAKLHDTAYALAVEVAAADLFVEQEELRFLQMLRDRLDLDKLTVAAIEAGARARYRLPQTA
jgi:tellurite resistance protein